MDLQFKVNNMSCEGCKNVVETTLNNDDRIEQAVVDLADQSVKVKSNKDLSVADINNLLAETPYNVENY
ncbi:MAG TPA: heavy metal-associated domain-containing protein [Alloiococcus sp.]|nr:heavy metal-associated domain-containing protein [Alloiococcus sp.]